MSVSPNVFAVSTAEFSEKVLKRSEEVPVAVDFWADWCGPCRMLTPVLERLVEELAGRVVLAKINVDEEPDLARRFRVSGIPAVKAFRNGQLVDEFAGARDARFVRSFFEKLAPSQDAQTLAQAKAHRQAGNAAVALECVRPLLTKEGVSTEILPEALLLTADILLTQKGGDLSQVPALLDRIANEAPRSKEVEILDSRRQLLAFYDAETSAKDEGEAGAKYARAASLARHGAYEQAMETLLDLVSLHRRYREDAGRKALVLLFELLGADHPLVQNARRRLQVLL